MQITHQKQSEIGMLWGFSECSFKLIRQSENDTYEVTTVYPTQDKFILRLTPSLHRTKEAIQAELDFIESLGHSTIFKVCRPVSSSGLFIQEVQPYDDNKLYFAVLFEHAQGELARTNWNGLLDEQIVRAMGRTMAEMHNITSKKSSAYCGSVWKEIERNIPTGSETHCGATDINKIKKRADQGDLDSKALVGFYFSQVHPFLERCGEPTTNTYGIIHGDINVSNFFALRDTLYVFDFDEVQMNWFGSDIAVVLRASRYFDETGLVEGFNGDRFRKTFLDAYKESSEVMLNTGHLEDDMLNGFYLYREFYYASLAVDILHQARNNVKHFEPFIKSYCEEKVKRFHCKFGGSLETNFLVGAGS